VRPGVNGTVNVEPARFAACFDGRVAGEHDQVGQRDLLAAAATWR
jgi:hypothetical protein